MTSVMKRGFLMLASAILAITASTSYAGDRWVLKTASDRWTWLEDYAYFSATYQLVCEPDRECEFGSGMKIGGKPRGTKSKFMGERRISVYGLGAIHVRAADGRGDVKVQMRQSESENFTRTVPWNP